MPQLMCYLQAQACAALLDKVEQQGKASAFADAFRTDLRRGFMLSKEHRDQLAGFLQ